MELTSHKNFTIEEVADLFKFTVGQSPVSTKAISSLCTFTIVPAVLVTLGLSPLPFFPAGIVVSLLLMLLFSVATFFLIVWFRKPQEFLLNGNEIIIHDKSYDQQMVTKYYIQPSYNKIESFQEAGYKVCMVHGKKHIVVARGLDQQLAEELLQGIKWYSPVKHIHPIKQQQRI